jgi:hypothetical protein
LPRVVRASKLRPCARRACGCARLALLGGLLLLLGDRHPHQLRGLQQAGRQFVKSGGARRLLA